MIQAWTLAWRNLRRNARRNFATGAAITLGFAGLVVVGGYILRVDRYLATSAIYLAHTGHVAIYKRDGLDLVTTKPRKFSLSLEEQSTISRILRVDPRVDFVGRYIQGTGLIGNGCRAIPFLAHGIEPAAAKYVFNHPSVVRELPELRRPVKGLGIGDAGLDSVSLSSVLARRIGKPRVASELGHPEHGAPIDCDAPDARDRIASSASVQLLGATFDGSFTAVETSLAGVHTTGLAVTEESSLHSHLKTLQSLFETDSVSYMGVYLKDARQVERYAQDLQRRLDASGVAASVHSFSEERLSPLYAGTHAFLGVMASFVGLIIGAVITLSILSATTMTVIERSREIGSLRSLGFRRSQVRSLFLRETLLLAGLSILTGLALSLSTCAVVNVWNIRYSPPGVTGDMQFMLHPDLLVCAGVTVLVLVLASGGTLLAVRGRVAMKIADLNSAVAG